MMTSQRRLLSAVLLLGLFVFQPASSLANGWQNITDNVALSTLRIDMPSEDGVGACTAFSINERYGYYLTANHCFGAGTIMAGTTLGAVVFRNEADDLMVIRLNIAKPALRPGRKPRVGASIGAFGYAWGIDQPRMHIGHVAAVDYVVEELAGPDFAGLWLAFDFPLIGGMSGGPVVDGSGRVVAINQWTAEGTGAGRAIDVILKHTRNFWQYRQ